MAKRSYRRTPLSQFAKGALTAFIISLIGLLVLSNFGYLIFNGTPNSEAGTRGWGAIEGILRCDEYGPWVKSNTDWSWVKSHSDDPSSPDDISPTVVISSPSDGYTLSRSEAKERPLPPYLPHGGQIPLTVTGSASDNSRTYLTYFCVDDAVEGWVGNDFQRLAAIPNKLGPHRIKVGVFDTSGNFSETSVTINLVK